ncbi:hypothetical protein [Salinigranum sp.]|uniref:hypothetical protein n=1 Tax=Salinigranum sp. TaxID=1966351 RepID=UPI00356457A4
MDDQQETTHGVLVDTEAIRTWSAERGVVPVYYPERDQYEMVYEGDVTEDSERHEWDEFSERFADRDEALVYDDADEADGDAPTARFVDQREARETSGVTPETDTDETSGVTPETDTDETSTAAWDVSAEGESEAEAETGTDRAGATDDRGRVDPNEDVAGTADPHADGTATTDLAGGESATDGETGTETEADGPAGIRAGTATVDVSTVDASDQGKRVFDRDGNEVGIVEAVDEDDERLYVDPDPGLLDEVKTELGWGSQDADDYVIVPSQIASRDGHQIVVYGG